MGKFSNSLTRSFNRSFLPSAQRGGRQFSYDQKAEAELTQDVHEQIRKQLLAKAKLAEENAQLGLRQKLIGETDFSNLTPRRIAELDRAGVKTSDIENIQQSLGTKLPTITTSSFVPTEEADKNLGKKFPGQLVEVTTKKKGDQVISKTLGNPISNERISTKTGHGTEYKGLSDFEKEADKKDAG